MVQNKTMEIMVGIFVAAGFAALFMLSMRVSNISTFNQQDGFTVTAHFDNIGGLKERAPVRAGGVLIGRVLTIEYDIERLEAVVKMVIGRHYDKLPEDSRANIYTAGLLGEQYIGIEPGGADEVLKEGSRIVETQSALVLERLIGKFLISGAEAGAETDKK